ncbi:MAG: DUF4397 domain-containing protein [Pelomonas sp.]|nr:DUF4397 domain-containing protein [Roseateles sp.]
MRFVKLAAATAALAAAGLLAACGGSSGSHAGVRLINASAGYASLDLTVNNTSIDTGVAFGSAGSYGSVDVSATTTQFLSSGTAVYTTTPTLTGGNNYALIAYGWQGGLSYKTLQENQTAPTSGNGELLVLNLAPDAGTLDTYLVPVNTACNATTLSTGTAIAVGVVGGGGSGYNTTTSGSYGVCIVGTGNTADVRLTIPSITLASASVNTLIITPTSGGVLVNGIFVVQGGSATPFYTSSARVRVVGSVPGTSATTPSTISGLLTSGSNSVNLLGTSSAVMPTIGNYQTVPSGAGAVVNLSVNGTALSTLTMPTMAPGGDYTLLVTGAPGATTTAILTDDNRLPLTAGYAKIRLVNGSSDPNASLSMSLDFTTIASNILPGRASAFTQVPSDTTGSTSEITVLTPTSTTNGYAFDKSGLSIVSQGVYNVYMLANSGTTFAQYDYMQGIIVRER